MSSTESTTKQDYKNTKYRKTKETQSNYREEKLHTKKQAPKKNYIQTTAAVIDCANVIPTYVFSCRTKLEKLLCLKCRGRTILANSTGSQTTKLSPLGPHDIIGSKFGSSTISKVFDKNGGIGMPCNDPSG